MNGESLLNTMPEVLLPWYDGNKRDLPWRKDKNPYHIWVSEIMLQQTRVEAVKAYYIRFMEKLPDVQSLADADEETLQKLWEGLGYYSRMRNLHRTAKIIVEQYAGEMPRTYEEILSLPGIGEYTAGAICSIAYDLQEPAVDGNVMRIMSRILEDFTPIEMPAFKKEIRGKLKDIYPERAGDFTQALIELGATVCGPNRESECSQCPCARICRSFQTGRCRELPVRRPKKKRRLEEKTVFILRCGDAYGLQKRPQKGLLAGLWEFPNVEGKYELKDCIAYLEKNGNIIKDINMVVEKKHIFTHIEWDMNGVYVELKEKTPQYIWIGEEEIRRSTGLPTAFRQFLTNPPQLSANPGSR